VLSAAADSMETLAHEEMILRCDRCYWCGTETIAPKKVGESHPKAATVDHLRSKPECVSGNEYHDRANTVNACFECNQRRSREWCQRMNAGLVFPTEWSIKQAEKRKQREQRKEERRKERELLKHCKPCRTINITVPSEPEAAFATGLSV